MDVGPRPNLLWRLFVLVGIGSLTAVAVSDQAWEKWEETVGDAVPRNTIRAALAATLGIHLVDALVATRRARAAGLEHPGRWGRSAFLWGFPVLLRLRRARRAALVGSATDLDAAVVVVEDLAA